MKILAIGNSFSQDATENLHQLCLSAGVDTKVVNLFIGGCSFEQHHNNIINDSKAYEYYLNGEFKSADVQIKATLLEDEWDVVTIQQVSQFSGKKETYNPYAQTVIKEIKKYAPNAKIYFHQTWGYEIDSDHEGFKLYNNSQQQMYSEILTSSYEFARQNNLPIIPCGQVIQDLRGRDLFRYDAGGLTLNRDGFHASLDYGRYALSATWFEILTGHSIYEADFAPDGTDKQKIDEIKQCVHKICSENSTENMGIPYSLESNRNTLDVYLPDSDNYDVLIYFHGGGIEAGDKNWEQGTIKRLVNKNIAVIMPNYRMYPNAKFPEFLYDAAQAVAWVKNNKAFSDRKIFVGGSSAGAYITAMLAYNPEYLNKFGIKINDISGYIINSAQMTTHFNVLRERGVNTNRIVVDSAAPVYYLDKDIKFPNALILVADNDMPCRYEQNMMFIKTLELMGCPNDKYKLVLMENSTHCSYDGSEKFADILTHFIKE